MKYCVRCEVKLSEVRNPWWDHICDTPLSSEEKQELIGKLKQMWEQASSEESL